MEKDVIGLICCRSSFFDALLIYKGYIHQPQIILGSLNVADISNKHTYFLIALILPKWQFHVSIKLYSLNKHRGQLNPRLKNKYLMSRGAVEIKVYPTFSVQFEPLGA
jgi:hypothetical protein